MVFIIDEPYEVSWSRNPIRYGIHTTTSLDVSGIVIEVKLKFKTVENTFSDIITQSLAPDKEGNVFIDISFILDSLLKYQLPDLVSNTVEPIVLQKGFFYIDYREISSLNGNQGWNTTKDRIRTVIKGGLSNESWSRERFFTDYLPSHKMFLTWQESGYLASPKEILFLHFLSVTSTFSQLSISVKVHYSDSAEILKSVLIGPDTGVNKYDIYIIPVGVEQLQLHLLNPDKNIQWWEVTILQDSTLLTSPYRFIYDYRYFKDEVQFNFFNSLGGIDSIRIKGNWETTHVRDVTEIERVSDPYAYNQNELPAEIDDNVFKERITWKGNAGFMNSKQQDRYRDLFLSRKRVAIFRGRWVNARILNKNTSLYNTAENLSNLPLEWSFGFDNVSYTPDSVAFGNMNLQTIAPYNLKVVAVKLNVHTLSWDSDCALAFSIIGHFYDQVNSSLDNNNVASFTCVSQTNTIDIDLNNFRHAKCKVFAYKSGAISKTSGEFTFPVLDVAACPIVTNIHVSSRVGSNVTIAWNGSSFHASFELSLSFTNNSDTGPLVPPTAWGNVFVDTNSATINMNTFLKMVVTVRAICIGSESPLSNPFTVSLT